MVKILIGVERSQSWKLVQSRLLYPRSELRSGKGKVYYVCIVGNL